ncbi:nudix hydrolase [Roseibium sp. TrichSKD4]|uniref:NUDIX hydrolase n=1 Tax=Roseibium sp. TrichSKD4 TaxID=744980 RepID=UPI0001E56E92|nr:NUDIX hydrolase [Roseibium sp. TrichSKD4]EFO32045.1 nudix hydrolase [Roseibium sp. TrichSKD4]
MTTVKPKPNQETWRLLDEVAVFDAPNRVKVNRQSVLMPNNQIVSDYYQIKLPSFATIYAITEKNETLVLRQYKHGVGEVCLTLPGGQVNAGEQTEFAARRELLEETGYGGGRWTVGPSMILHGNQKIARSQIFIAHHVVKLNEIESGDLEDATLVTMSRHDLRLMATSGLVPIASHVAAIGMAEMMFPSV